MLARGLLCTSDPRVLASAILSVQKNPAGRATCTGLPASCPASRSSVQRRPLFSRRLRCCSAEDRTPSSSSAWTEKWHILPPVTVVEQEAPPTALSWLRRRGPAMPHVALEKLFRSRQVRVCMDDPAADASSPPQPRLQRITRGAALSPGMQLLIPKAALPPTLKERTADIAHPAAGERGKALAAKLEASMLYCDDEVMVLNKAAGMPVQSGTDLPLAVDQVLAAHFVSPEGHQPRLVHRLDMAATGALAVARTQDAAAWLAAAFSNPAVGLAADATEDQQLPLLGSNGGPWVRKVYWAVVHTSQTLPSPGTMDMPLPGRKHQIRMHCAKSLCSPIVGDQRYGSWADASVREQVQHLQGAVARTWAKHLQLHCRKLSFCKGGQQPAVHALAPLPEHMQKLFTAQGWTFQQTS